MRGVYGSKNVSSHNRRKLGLMQCLISPVQLACLLQSQICGLNKEIGLMLVLRKRLYVGNHFYTVIS